MQTKNAKLLVLLMVVGLGGLCLPKLASAITTNSTVSVDVSPVLTLSSDGTVTLGALTPDSSGKQSIASDTVSTTTNDASGVTVTLKDSDTTYTLTSGSNTIAAAAGTYAVPAALANGEWGWRVDSLGTFGSGPTTTLSNGAPSALTFAAIPINSTPRTIQTTSASGSDSVTVWYSARVNSDQPNGTYTDIVTYTATTN